LAWANRFETPTRERLTQGIPDEQRKINSALMERLDQSDLTGPSIVWMGLPWRWTLIYQPAQPDLSPIYVICDPERPRIAMKLEAGILESIPARKLHRATRDALAAGRQVGSTRWIEWQVEHEDCIRDLMKLVEISASAKTES